MNIQEMSKKAKCQTIARLPTNVTNNTITTRRYTRTGDSTLYIYFKNTKYK